MVTKAHVNGRSHKMRVVFSLPASIWADSIYLVGDFNNWNQTATPLELDGTHWSVALDLEVDTTYQYRYLLDNMDWTSDWNADYHVPGSDGVSNSVVVTQHV